MRRADHNRSSRPSVTCEALAVAGEDPSRPIESTLRRVLPRSRHWQVPRGLGGNGAKVRRDRY
jgi:hypothetical protein